MADPVQGGMVSANAEQAIAKTKEAKSADARNVAQKGLAEVQTAQACVATVAQAKAANIDVTLPKVCEKYVQKARQEQK